MLEGMEPRDSLVTITRKISGVAGQFGEKRALWVRRKRFCRGEMPQNIENDFIGFDERSFKARRAKLQDGIAFVEVPG